MSQNSNINTNESSDDIFNIFLLNNLIPNSTSINCETFNEISEMEKEKFFSTSKKEEKEFNSSTNIYNIKSLVNTYKTPINNNENNIYLNKYGKHLFNELFSTNQVGTSTTKETINKNQENIFLGKKRKIFKVIYKNNFIVFNSGNYDNETRKLINETVDDIKNGKIKKDLSLEESELPKKKSKKQRNIKTRKENSDNIIKKIKTRFLKALKIKINEILKMAGSKKFFCFLPQAFITNINKAKNNSILNMTYKEILTKNFISWKKSDSNGINNYLHNKYILEYLENNKDTFKNLNYNIFNLTYSQLYQEYFESKEFEMEIANLIKNETLKYTKRYIIKASNFLNYFHKKKI